MQLAVDRDSDVPVGTQLAAKLRNAIERGELAPGDQLPSLRDAAALAGVNVNTVRAVYAKLEAAGVVSTEQGRGSFVTDSRPGPRESAQRRELSDEIARLEAELVSLPALGAGPVTEPGRRRGARLLTVAELTTVRDLLADRVAELRAARFEIRERVERRNSTPATPVRTPSRRSSSSRAGARIRWT